MGSKIPGAQNNPNYKATGIWIVLHPLSKNSFYALLILVFCKQKKNGLEVGITPCLPFEQKRISFIMIKRCNNFDNEYYSKYKKMV